MSLNIKSENEKVICDLLRGETLKARLAYAQAVGEWAGFVGHGRPNKAVEAREACERARDRYLELSRAYDYALTAFLCCHHEGRHEKSTDI